MSTAVRLKLDTEWLELQGPKALEQLIRAIVFHPAAPVLIADPEGYYQAAGVGSKTVLSLAAQKLADEKSTDLPRIWHEFLNSGANEGVLKLPNPSGDYRNLNYVASSDILPARHVLAFGEGSIPSWIRDYALCLVDLQGSIVAWYEGAARIYRYSPDIVRHQHISFLYEHADVRSDQILQQLHRAEVSGHVGSECWQKRGDGSRFWANVILVALRDEAGILQGFARIVRDFSDRHERDEKIRLKRSRAHPLSQQSAVAGVISGQLDHPLEVNDALLEMLGYNRQDLEDGAFSWLDLTPAEFEPLDEIAYEEALQCGGCTPYEKELIHKNGTRLPVLISTAILRLSPLHWISFVQDLSARNRFEALTGHESSSSQNFIEIVGESLPLRRIQQQIEVVAPTDATVLVLGETGTGKELVARAIHRLSPRSKMPFVTLNCAAIPTGLLESELFGYERGAFTGALAQKIGRFEMAHRGTLFLDEVGDIPIDLQPKLLRALQEKSFERLGGTKTIPIDVRLVAATNRNLNQMMSDKLFRSDLYYRLKVFPITTPPLRERPEDIPILVRHFTAKYSLKMGRNIETIPSAVMQSLVEWTWPGNVRELENFIERAVILSSGTALRAPIQEMREGLDPAPRLGTLEQVERDHILCVLRENKGVVSVAASKLGMPRTTLNAMMKKLGISRRDF